jgi:hypothetical protein
MAIAFDGPTWCAGGVMESGGLYPLRVESAVRRLVEKLLPGVITTTTQARYYALHTLAWSTAHDRALDFGEAAALVRRCEVVMAAAHRACRDNDPAHVHSLPAAHGEDRLVKFSSDGALDLAAAARPGGFSKNGFADTYMGPERALRLLAAGRYPGPGERAELEPLREGLDGLLELAARDELSAEQQLGAISLCPCKAAGSPDGSWLRSAMFEQADPDVQGDRYRQTACAMLLDALADGPADVTQAFRLAQGFGEPIGGDDRDATARRAWRAAILRNYSVSAWRDLWRWLSEVLTAEQLNEAELAERLAASVGKGSVSDLLAELPPRVEGQGIVAAEEQVREVGERGPRDSLRLLALGALRLEDLDAETRHAYLGADRDDLGPEWVETQLKESGSASLAGFAVELLDVMLRRARHVAYSKMSLDSASGKLYLPTRLREREGKLWMVEVEGDAEVSLRTWTLFQVLCGLGAARVDGEGRARVTDAGRELRGRLG